MTTLTVYRGTNGRWMVRTNNPAVPRLLRDSRAGDMLLDQLNVAAAVRQVEECNPGCIVVSGESR